MITLALSKGRILQQILPMLEQIEIVATEDPLSSRKLIFQTNREHLQLIIIRATDVPTYVQFGAADVGLVGKDGLMEHGGEGLFELLDLNISRCRLMTAVLREPLAKSASRHPGLAARDVSHRQKRLQVATKYANVARQYYQSQGIQAEIIKLYGAMELAPLVGLADEIVDLVETGNTLKANNLVEKDLIANISCRLVANSAAMRTKHDAIAALCRDIASVIPGT